MSKSDQQRGSFEAFMKELSDDELGALVREYVLESNHNNWDGHNSKDKAAYGRLFADIELYGRNR